MQGKKRKPKADKDRADRVHWQDVGDFAVDAAFDDMDGTEEELINQLTRGYGSDD